MHNQEMDIGAIMVFVKVVESGSFSGAARLLKMPKTTVSAKIAALEKRLGVTLIQRTTRKLSITEAGQNYYQHCAKAVREIEQGESQILASQEKPTGILRITAPHDVGHSLLPGIIEAYLSQHPDIQLDLMITNRYVDLVGEGVDIAIRAGELKDSTLVAKKFFEIKAGLWASPAYLKKYGTPEHPKELNKHRIIAMASLRGDAAMLTDGRSSHTAWTHSQITVDDPETIKALIVSNQGIGWLPNFLSASDSSKKLVQVLPSWKFTSEFSFHFVYPGQKYASPKVRSFIQIASQVVEADLKRF
jgi:DNA-binding transcriptional LysR family regulator